MYEARLAGIVAAMGEDELAFSKHAMDEMLHRRITRTDIEDALRGRDAEIIEDYRDDPRGVSCLVVCWRQGRALHVHISYPPRPKVITVYWPDSQPWKWETGYRRRA